MEINGKRIIPATPYSEDMPSLRAFWEELRRGMGVGSLFSSGRTSGSGRRFGSGSRYGSGSRRGSQSGSQSGSQRGSAHGIGGDDNALGYGLGLVVPDLTAEERVQLILRKLCEKDAARAAIKGRQ